MGKTSCFFFLIFVFKQTFFIIVWGGLALQSHKLKLLVSFMTIYESLSICSSSMFFRFLCHSSIFFLYAYNVCGDQQRFVYYLHLGIFEDKFSTKDSKINSSSCLEQVKSKHLPLHSVYMDGCCRIVSYFLWIYLFLCVSFIFFLLVVVLLLPFSFHWCLSPWLFV